MKDTGSNSRKNSQQSNDTLIYILLILLLALLIGGLGYWWWQRSHPKNNWVYDYESALGKSTDTPKVEDLKRLILGNRERWKTVNRFLNDKMKSRKLTDKEKAEIREELKGVNMKADEILKEQKLSELDPSTIPQFYKHFYEQGKMLVRARTKASVNRTKEELRRQLEIQEKWSISEAEGKEINKQMKVWIDKWYNQAKKEIMPKYESKGKWPRNRNFLPEKIKGKKVSGYPPPDATFNFFLDVNNMNRSGGQELIVLFQKPFQVNYIGYDGFLTSEDKENTEEGELFGITDYGKLEGDEWNDGTSYRAWGKGDNIKPIRIRLKKEIFFNRLGHEEWLTKLDEKGTRFYDDICFEALVDTIAHELAHAIVATFEFRYEGEEEGGHGKLFYDICKEIEEMVRADPKFEEFEKWWYLA
ncbi:protein of unknown function [endosymbiont DhMRE of Dentiscutata heterogama]|uniref:hypothetical protein n=1 Tax=endosymbiont DhMRE of Dentiscutata heterogama TaxID=1609546 RepID=UPI000629DA48|nr:hypothetical protein [endosymbiont DhMRE of Dentiscutata heterogama]CFW92930.1 protein of unknown function [endosymbiont DhMRE of Dentiscutata heterogama]